MSKSETRPFTVVLADDETQIRRALRRTLEKRGTFEVVGEATTGAEATSLALAEQPDAVIMDLAMPGVDGLQALPAVRVAAPKAKIVILSGMARFHDMREKALDQGAAAVFDKGTDPRSIAKTLVSLLTWSGARRD